MPGPDPYAAPVDPRKRAWITLVTRSTYMPGVVLLIHTLYKHKSKHTLIVQYTSALEQDCITTLRKLNSFYPLLRTQLVEPVPLPDGLNPISPRFDDTLTKLRAFETLTELKYQPEPRLEVEPAEICFLDADMMIFRNLDDIFDIHRPGPDWIAAHHACICNIDNDPWAPEDWNADNCATSAVAHPEALNAPQPSSEADGARPTYRMLNSGVFVCTPSKELWERMEYFRTHDERVKTFTFPDQNFLDVFFADHWVPIGWHYNAFKTHRYWHSNAWRDDEVRALHYIVDKPWEARKGEGIDGKTGQEGKAGYKGRDGVTHGWWWREYDSWEKWLEKEGQTGKEVLDGVRKYVCVDSGLGKTNFQK